MLCICTLDRVFPIIPAAS